MSSVKWCDPGNHAFKAGIKGAQNFQGIEYGDDGAQHVVSQDACPEHAYNKTPAVPSIEAPQECPECGNTSLHYSAVKGANVCVDCGYNSAES